MQKTPYAKGAVSGKEFGERFMTELSSVIQEELHETLVNSGFEEAFDLGAFAAGFWVAFVEQVMTFGAGVVLGLVEELVKRTGEEEGKEAQE